MSKYVAAIVNILSVCALVLSASQGNDIATAFSTIGWGISFFFMLQRD